MGRHSRRGPAPKAGAADMTARRTENSENAGTAERAEQRLTPGRGAPRLPDGTPAQGVPRFPGGTPAQGVPRFPGGTPAQGVPRLPDGTPARGVPGFGGGAPARGGPRLPDGTPARGVPRLPEGTPAHGVPGFREGAPARGGHPEQRERGGGWGEFAGRAGAGVGPGPGSGPGVVLPRQRRAGQEGGPRQEYLDAFRDAGAGGADLEDVDVFAPRARGPRATDEPPADAATAVEAEAHDGGAHPVALPAQRSGGKGRAFTGVAAAAVTTVLAVIVAGQVAEGRPDDGATQSRSAADQDQDAHAPGGAAPSPSASAAALTYEEAMGRTYPLSATLKASGTFDAVPGFDKAPGTGHKYTYRVDVEQGLGLDGNLFAEAVQKTLNDSRSWAHGGARTFERISSGKPDFVITLASPGTTAAWCAKSGLDTTEDNVSCDSASTERVMINAYRWAQGSTTYGDKIHPYRQMLINHEVGHRLGYGHVTCQKNGELAPVMQQQTKFLDHDGIHCLPNPWPYPGS
ncbi:DUF3152 domain-containing protein [Streptomyces sp. NPDC048665]|uniref:DUF3152 domain-containing protein n=1 Tax=Streptomyces sp. NPDC048665 TaxID=3155490 RepID=UPI00343CF4E8